ncbi:hypothetical protein [Micromonospora chokoriensis]|uniref:hypothetical protein n=1 Tax=Micromonospora chokoriensis TaxID=356851 RepID=UPI0004C3ABFD|nr:hypothetical protein [Micromonospora chokoriensis]
MIDQEETYLRSLFARAADDLPGDGISLERALADGERTVRRHRQMTLVGVVGTVLALLGSAALLAGVRPSVGPSPADEPPPPSSTTAPTGPPTVAPEAFDPTLRLFRLGSVAAEAVDQSYRTDVKVLAVDASVPEAISPGRPVEPGPIMGVGRSVTVRLGARGVDLFANQRQRSELDGPPPPVALPGAPVAAVDGHSAYLYRDGDEALLSWQYAPDGWMSISMSKVDDPEEFGRQIAAGLVWETQRVSVPFAPTALPAGATLKGIEVRTYDGQWLNVDVHYRTGGPGPRQDLSIGVSNGIFAGDGSDFEKSRVMVAGRVGSVMSDATGIGVFRVAQVPGCAGCVTEVSTESPAGASAVGGRNGGLDMAASIRLVDGWNDLASWRPLQR